jgi:hypothetical protein
MLSQIYRLAWRPASPLTHLYRDRTRTACIQQSHHRSRCATSTSGIFADTPFAKKTYLDGLRLGLPTHRNLVSFECEVLGQWRLPAQLVFNADYKTGWRALYPICGRTISQYRSSQAYPTPNSLKRFIFSLSFFGVFG